MFIGVLLTAALSWLPNAMANRCAGLLVSALEKQTKTGFFVVVGGYGTGAKYADEVRATARALGRPVPKVIQVHPIGDSPPPIRKGSWDESVFDFNLAEATPDALARQIETIADREGGYIIGVEPGCEEGVILASQLSRVMPIGTVPRPFHEGQRNKFELAGACAKAGLDCIRGQVVNNPHQLKHVASSLGLLSSDGKQINAVLKPLSEHGSIGVFFPNSVPELESAFTSILQTPGSFGKPIREVLVQERIRAPELVSNTVRHGGRTVVTSVMVYKKRPGPKGNDIYWIDRKVKASSVPGLIEYNVKVMDAVDLRSGPAHSEIFDVPGRGFVAGDIAARPMGAKQSDWERAVFGRNQLELSLLAHWAPEMFFQQPTILDTPADGAVYTTACFKPGMRWRPNLENQLRTLPAFHQFRPFSGKSGEELPLTVDLLTAPGDILLVGSTKDVDRSIDLLIEWEKNGQLFESTGQ